MDDLSATSTIQTVIFKKSAQIGATEAGNNWIGYIIDLAPGPTMIVQPTVETAKRYSKQRIDPLIENTPRVREKVAPGRARDAGNTMLMKDFAAGVLVITGANSAVGLRSMPVRYLFLDEVDAYPGDVEGEGDPVSLADARTRTFSYRAKRFITSTPKIKGISRITREFDRSDQRQYFVPCPLCGVFQVLDFARLRWPPGQPELAQYQCDSCETLFAEHNKTAMLAAGEWRATAQCTNPTVRGYMLNGLYSPIGWLSWPAIAQQWEDAASDVEARKTFTNTVLGEAWEEEADTLPDWQRLYERREEWPYNTVPERGLFLTAGADVQGDRIEVDVWAWGRGLESWLVQHIVLDGDPGHASVWLELSAFLSRTWEHSSGRRMSLQRFAIDTGGFTQSVYTWARTQSKSLVLPMRGFANYDRVTPVSGPTNIEVMENGVRHKRGIQLWTVSVSTFKRELYRWLTLPKPTDEEMAGGARYPQGYVHMPTSVSDEWVKQLVAEQLVIVRSRSGLQARTEWRPVRARNEALDCRNYARAAVWLAGADRWPESMWRQLEDQLGLTPIAPPPPPRPDTPPSPLAVGTPQQAAGDIRFHRVVRRRIFNTGTG
jgi:phage terminase large subunit GpA-like protein